MSLLETTPMPDRMRRLRRNEAGYPVPYFVWVNPEDGVPDFRVIDPSVLLRAIRNRWCWICGTTLGRNVSFVIGPMCSINHVSAEPPSHQDCARYAAMVCPFLANPKKRRREGRMPEGASPDNVAGEMIARNPGVALVWNTSRGSYFPRPVDNGVLFHIGKPESVEWYAHGRAATRAEVLEAFDSGCPTLENLAREDGPHAMRAFEAMKAAALRLVPEA